MKLTDIKVIAGATLLIGSLSANAALNLPTLDLADLGAAATWIIGGIVSIFGLKASPIIVAWATSKLSAVLGR